MPTTCAPRAAARAAARCLTEVLPADALGLVLYQLPLAHDIAAVAPTCHLLCDAAKLARKLRPFSNEVVTLGSLIERRRPHPTVLPVAALPDGRIITGHGESIKIWHDGACERTIQATRASSWRIVFAVAVLPGGARFVSVSDDGTAKLWTLNGALERTFEVGSEVLCVAALPDGVHFVVGLGDGLDNDEDEDEVSYEVRLYNVDGTRVHTFTGHTNDVNAVAVTPDGQHIISGSDDNLVKVWSVATKSLVSTCAGHTNSVCTVAAMADGQRILSGGYDATVRVWLLDGTHQNTFSELHNDLLTALVALPDNQHALSASDDKTVKLFNVNDGSVLRTFKHHGWHVTSLALLPDGLRFVSGSNEGTACIAYHGLAPQ
jgi:WD40 repeat protein